MADNLADPPAQLLPRSGASASDSGDPRAGRVETGLTSAKRQRDLWRLVIRARYVTIAASGLTALLPQAADKRLWILVGVAFFALPYNGIYDLLMRRTGVLSPVLAYSDQVLAIAVAATMPELVTPALLFMLAITANAAVAFGRRVAIHSTIVSFAGVSAVVVLHPWSELLTPVSVYIVLAVFTSVGVGAITEVERESRQRFTELVSGIDAIVWEQLTTKPSTLYVNEEAVNMLGYPASDWRTPGTWSRLVHPDDEAETRQRYVDAIRSGESTELEYRMISADGETLWVHDRIRVEDHGHGRPKRVRGVMLDITATKEAQTTANQFVNLVDGIKLALFVFGLDDANDNSSLTVLAINPEGAELAGIGADDAVGTRFDDTLALPGGKQLRDKLAHAIRSGAGFSMEELVTNPEIRGGRVYSAFAFPLPGEAVGLSMNDITDRTMAAEVLRRQALHDGLTGLPNRTLLNERLRMALKNSVRDGVPVSLLMMDLDQFKEVNDALGHDHGDRLLIEMSLRLQRVLRDADTIARLGGDEFAVLLTDAENAEAAMQVARRVREALEQPFQLGGISLQTNASIGIALFPDHAEDAESLAQRADVAMYSAKRAGIGTALYAPEHDKTSVRRLALLGELRGAIQDNELVMYYQPSLDVATAEVHSAEALVRWDHPEHGLMPPGEFIELAEVSGLIQPMTRWIINHVLHQVRSWLDDGLAIKVGVNISVRNLYDRDLVPWLADLLVERGVDASLLKLEITESELMDDPLLALDVLGKLKALGVSTSIDDFGTGYSSLAYLKHLPIDELKIDKSFVGNMVNDHSDLTIVRSTIDLSHSLGLTIVAEGVEDHETLRLLADLNCDRAQGYIVSRAIPADDFRLWLTSPDGLPALRAQLTPIGLPDR